MHTQELHSLAHISLHNVVPRLPHGGLAHMVERVLCKHEAMGSIPITSKPFFLSTNIILIPVSQTIILEAFTVDSQCRITLSY